MSIIMMYMAVRVHAYKSEGAIIIATPLSPGMAALPWTCVCVTFLSLHNLINIFVANNCVYIVLEISPIHCYNICCHGMSLCCSGISA